MTQFQKNCYTMEFSVIGVRFCRFYRITRELKKSSCKMLPALGSKPRHWLSADFHVLHATTELILLSAGNSTFWNFTAGFFQFSRDSAESVESKANYGKTWLLYMQVMHWRHLLFSFSYFYFLFLFLQTNVLDEPLYSIHSDIVEVAEGAEHSVLISKFSNVSRK